MVVQLQGGVPAGLTSDATVTAGNRPRPAGTIADASGMSVTPAAEGSKCPRREVSDERDSVAGWKDFCLAVSGGLVSVLEMATPLWHVGWTGAWSGPSGPRREILRLIRTPLEWGEWLGDVVVREAGTKGPGLTGEGAGARVKSSRPLMTSSGVGLATPSNSMTDTTGSSDWTLGADNTTGIIALCEGGWIGWYRWAQRFEVRNVDKGSPGG